MANPSGIRLESLRYFALRVNSGRVGVLSGLTTSVFRLSGDRLPRSGG